MQQRTALVTGGAQGIGAAIVRRLAGDGFQIILHYNKSAQAAKELQESLAEQSLKVELLQLNLADPSLDRETLEEALSHKTGGIDVLINNAGQTQDGPMVLMESNDWDQVLNLNLRAPFFLSQWFVRQLPRKQQGVIVNVGSLSGQIGNAGQANYSASKSGLMGLTKSMAREFGRKDIRVNCVAVGIVETSMSEGVEFLNEIKKQIPLKRFAQPEEIAGVVSFLCSTDSSYVTGQTLGVNGGLFCQ